MKEKIVLVVKLSKQKLKIQVQKQFNSHAKAYYQSY